MPNMPQESSIDLQEVHTRYFTARQLLTRTVPALAEVWSSLEAALSDTPALTAETARLREELRHARLHRANLAAAALATIAADYEGERDPLSYLCDELRAQGHETNPRRIERPS